MRVSNQVTQRITDTEAPSAPPVAVRKMKLDNVDKLAKRYFDLCVMADRVTDASQMKDYVDAMHEAAQATQAAMGDVDEIEDKLDDIAGINEEFDDIERAVGDRDLFNVDGVSDEDLEAEFNDLLGDDVGATTAPAAPAPHRAPAAPAPHRAPAAPAPHRAPAREPELPVPAVLAREESDPFAGLDDLEVPSDVPGAAVVEPAAAASAGAQ